MGIRLVVISSKNTSSIPSFSAIIKFGQMVQINVKQKRGQN